jgi:hypothetical protein
MVGRSHSVRTGTGITLVLTLLVTICGVGALQAPSAWGALKSGGAPSRSEARGRVAAQAASLAAFAWGFNPSGQLGNGTISPTGCSCIPTPGPVTGLSSLMALAGGGAHALALASDGTVWAWGANGSGQLGNGTISTNACACIPTPGPVTGLTSVRGVAGGFEHSLAVKSDGTVWAWGANQDGELGNGTSGNTRSTPVPVSSLGGVTAVAAGDAFSLALRNDGTVWAWGTNSFGELGTGTSGGSSNIRVPVSNLSGATTIAAGSFFGLALAPPNFCTAAVAAPSARPAAVSSGCPSLAESPADVNAGATVTVTWANIPNPSGLDGITLYNGASSVSLPAFATGQASGSRTITLDSSLPSGTAYTFRYFTEQLDAPRHQQPIHRRVPAAQCRGRRYPDPEHPDLSDDDHGPRCELSAE